jgi:hypothetical protein
MSAIGNSRGSGKANDEVIADAAWMFAAERVKKSGAQQRCFGIHKRRRRASGFPVYPFRNFARGLVSYVTNPIETW